LIEDFSEFIDQDEISEKLESLKQQLLNSEKQSDKQSDFLEK
jgi:hypothetical protein